MEARRYSRFIVEEMGIGGKILFTTDVKIHDISLGGACISIEKKLNMGSEYKLRAEHDDRSIQIKAVVMWEKMSGSRTSENGDIVPVYTVGLKFRNVIANQGAEVVDFISRIYHDSSLRLTGVRVNFFDDGRSVLSYPKDYFVKRIGLGGMLLELEHKLSVDQKFHMEVIFPEDKDPFGFMGRIASCMKKPDLVPERYEIGVEFLEMSESGKSRLRAFISSLEDIGNINPLP